MHRAINHRLSGFDRMFLAEWRKLKLPVSDHAVVVAVSGGADSTALALALWQLIAAGKVRVRPVIAHLDHGLRTDSKKDARWVKELAGRLDFDVVIGRSKVAEKAKEDGDNLEQAARKARYDFLERTAKRKKATVVLTAHTMDDQAETVLLRLVRGSGSIGLGGMESQRSITKGSDIQLIRPLLWARREDTERYCKLRKTEFLQDEMNNNEQFARVKVRKQLLPLMQSFNTKVVEALSRTATLLREDDSVLAHSSSELLEKAAFEKQVRPKSKVPALDVKVLLAAPGALRRRALKEWISKGRGTARRLEMVHVLAVEGLLRGEKGGRVVELPDGFRVVRRRNWLEFSVENN